MIYEVSFEICFQKVEEISSPKVIPYLLSQNFLRSFFRKLKLGIGLILLLEIWFLIEITSFLLIVDLVSSAFLYSRFRLPETATWTNIWLQFFFRDLGFNCNIFDLSSITFYSICSRYKTFDLWRKSQALAWTFVNFWKIQIDSEIFWSIWNYSELFWNITKYSEIF